MPKEDAFVVRVDPKNSGQREACRLYASSDVLFLLGPAGCGKSHISVALAARDVSEKRRKRLVFLRPAVECGRSLGSLPGTLDEKLEPYKQPFLHALRKVSFRFPESAVSFEAVSFVQGVTWEDSVVVCDEAQNLSYAELRTLLTRLGRNSKLLVLGDPEQPYVRPTQDGYLTDLEAVVDRLEGLPSVSVIDFDPDETLRHPLIAAMLRRL